MLTVLFLQRFSHTWDDPGRRRLPAVKVPASHCPAQRRARRPAPDRLRFAGLFVGARISARRFRCESSTETCSAALMNGERVTGGLPLQERSGLN